MLMLPRQKSHKDQQPQGNNTQPYKQEAAQSSTRLLDIQKILIITHDFEATQIQVTLQSNSHSKTRRNFWRIDSWAGITNNLQSYMAGLPRPAVVAPVRKSNMRPPPRPSTARSQSVVPSSRMDRSGAISPAESIASIATQGGTKRKERDFDHDDEETNINVVVRCRGRNEREVRENSGVVLLTEGVKGKSLELSMGPSALSNKTYRFDKVFSSAADQAMIYDDVVTPILDEVSSQFMFLCASILKLIDACGLQLHNFRLWTDWNWKDLYHVR